MEISKVPLARWSGVEGRPLVLAGPCRAESPEVLSECARRFVGPGADVLTATAWRSGSVDPAELQAGRSALSWLRETASRHGLRCGTGVATAEQIRSALEHGIELLWIDSATVSRPAELQVVVHALRSCPLPVLVANPEQHDVELWVEAIERLTVVGVEILGGLHVGLPPSGGPHHPSAPGWDLVIELRRRFPELPVVSAVSRLPGGREQVRELAQSALDIGLEGLMFEVHPQPDHAWEGSERHVLPERAAAVMASVRTRLPASPEVTFNVRLAELRSRIDAIDRRLLELLADRMGVVEEIALLKRSGNVASLQVERWRSLLAQRIEWAERLGLTPALVQEVYQAIHGESVLRQGEVLDREPSESQGRVAEEPDR